MAKLEFAKGVKSFELDGGQVISFSPTDVRLVQRIYAAIEKLDKEQEDYEHTGNDAEDMAAFFEYVEKMDQKMQEAIDGIFGVHIDRAAFGGASLYSLAEGLPLWANFLFAVLDEMEVEFSNNQNLRNSRLQKLASKYKK